MKFSKLISGVSVAAIMASMVTGVYAETATVTETVSNEYIFKSAGITYTNDTSKVFKGSEVGDAGFDDNWYFYNPDGQNIYMSSGKTAGEELTITAKQQASYISLKPSDADQNGKQTYIFDMQYSGSDEGAYVYAVNSETDLTSTSAYSTITDILYSCQDSSFATVTIEIDNSLETGSTVTVKKADTEDVIQTYDYKIGGISFSKGRNSNNMKVRNVSCVYEKTTEYNVASATTSYTFEEASEIVFDDATQVYQGASVGYGFNDDWYFYNPGSQKLSVTSKGEFTVQNKADASYLSLKPSDASTNIGKQTYEFEMEFNTGAASDAFAYIYAVNAGTNLTDASVYEQLTEAVLYESATDSFVKFTVEVDNTKSSGSVVTVKKGDNVILDSVSYDYKIGGISFSKGRNSQKLKIKNVTYTNIAYTAVGEPEQPPIEDGLAALEVNTENIGIETGASDTVATGFLTTITNTGETTPFNLTISWTITDSVDNEGTTSYKLPTEITIDEKASVYVGLIVNGLYDENATAVAELSE